MTESIRVRVETLTDGAATFEYSSTKWATIRTRFGQASTAVSCLDCGDLTTIVGGIPSAMPTCPGCGDLMHGVVSVSELDSN